MSELVLVFFLSLLMALDSIHEGSRQKTTTLSIQRNGVCQKHGLQLVADCHSQSAQKLQISIHCKKH